MNFLRDALQMGAGQSAHGGGGGGGGGGGNNRDGHQQNQDGGGMNWSQLGHNMGQMGRDLGGLFGGGGGGGGAGGPFPGQRRPGSPRQQQAAPPETMKPPPASNRALRTLPTVTVAPEDLVDETNRECCICFEAHHLKNRVVRLPCAHIYHPPCIVDWLRRSCTCPVCRYELPTDVPMYEATRRQRMARRKPRYAAYELRRLSPKELLNLASRSRISLPGNGLGMERREIIDSIAKSGRIELIAAPEPVEHRLSDLKALGVGKLRRTMEDAGVFFSKEDVVEKSDMVDLFLRSGRVALLPEEEEEADNEDEREEDDGVMAESVADVALRREQAPASPPKKRRSVNTRGEEEDATWSEASSSQGGNSTEGGAGSLSNLDGGDIPSVIDMFGGPNGTEPLPPPPPEVPAAPAAAASNTGSDPAPSAPPFASAYPATMGEGQEDELDAALAAGSLPNVTRNTRIASYQGHSVSELKSIASGLGIDVSDCVEKREMVGRIADFESYVDIDA